MFKKTFLTVIAFSLILTNLCFAQTTQKENPKPMLQISDIQAKEIALKAFNQYFSEKIENKNLTYGYQLLKDQNTKRSYWLLSWHNLMSQFDQKIIQYIISIDAQTGKILNISAQNFNFSQKPKKFNLQKAQEIALHFLEEKSICPTKNLKFVEYKKNGQAYQQEDENYFYLIFSHKKNPAIKIIVQISKIAKKVIAFEIKD